MFTSLKVYLPRLFGLAFWQAWWVVLGNTDAVVSKAHGTPLWGIGINAFTLLYTAMTLGYLVVMIYSLKVGGTIASRGAALPFSAGCAGLGTLFLMVSSGLDASFVATVGIVAACTLTAIGNASIMCMWGELWASVETSRVGLHVLASYILAFLCFFGVEAMPAVAQRAFACLLPLASVACLKLALAEPRRKPVLSERKVDRGIVARALLFLFVVSVAHGFTQASSDLVDPNAVGTHLLIDCAMLAVILLFILLSVPEHEPPVVFRFVLFSLCAGLVLLVVDNSLTNTVGNGVFLAGIHGLEMVVLVVASDVAFRSGSSVAFYVGCCFFLLRLGSVASHIAVAQLGSLGVYTDSFSAAATVVSLLVLLFLALVVLSDSTFQGLFNMEPTVSKTPAPAPSSCAEIAARFDLTGREREVLELIAQGRTNPYIAKELDISPNTARNHVSNIYRKVGIYDRQQLLDLVNGRLD